MKRRKLLQAGLIASSTGLTAATTLLNPAFAFAAINKPLALDHFIFDERFADCRNTASSLTQANVTKHKVSGDLTELWYQHIDAAWKHGPATVAGITTESALFYLQRLAWIHQLRLIYHGYHPVSVSGEVQHTFKGGENFLTAIASMNKQSWPASLGLALTHIDASLSVQKEINIHMNIAEPAQAMLEPRDVILVSWILAPLSSLT